MMAFSLHEMAQFTIDVGVREIIYTGVIQGIGLGFIFVPLSTVAFATLAPRYRNEGTAMFSLVRNIGSSIGISAVVTLLGRQMQIAHAGLSESVTPFSTALHGPGVPHLWDVGTRTGVLALNGEVTRQALAIAYVNDFRLMMYMTLAALPLLLLLRPAKRPA
jgi:DHA2 family multidrug resistance protein